jgi:tetratricopeptide (TPR) repeat protein
MLLPFLLLLILDDPAKLIAHGVAALGANDLTVAQTDFEQATKQAPSNATAWMLLAQTRAKRGDSKSAQEAAAQAERFGGKDPAVLQALANFYGSAMRDLPRAAAFGARYAQLAPANDTTAWQRVAALYLAIGKPDQAIDAALRGKARDSSADLRLILAKAYMERKDWSKANAEFNEAIKLNPYDEGSRFAAAQAHLVRQDFAGAEQVLLDARKVFDKSPQLELTLGVAYYGERNFTKAVDQFLLTMSLAPDLPQPYAFLGRILEHAGPRLPDAIEAFTAFEKRNPESPLGYLLHAKAIVLQLPSGNGFPPEAEQALALVQKSLSLNDADADAQFQMGVLLYRKGDLEPAAAHLERSVQLNAKDSAAHFQLARVYAGLGRKEDAARERGLHEKLAEEENAPPPASQERKK